MYIYEYFTWCFVTSTFSFILFDVSNVYGIFVGKFNYFWISYVCVCPDFHVTLFPLLVYAFPRPCSVSGPPAPSGCSCTPHHTWRTPCPSDRADSTGFLPSPQSCSPTPGSISLLGCASTFTALRSVRTAQVFLGVTPTTREEARSEYLKEDRVKVPDFVGGSSSCGQRSSGAMHWVPSPA